MSVTAAGPVVIDHFVRGRVEHGTVVEHRSRERGAAMRTPALDLAALAGTRATPPPAAGLRIDEIIDFLDEAGRLLRDDAAGHLAEALDRVAPLSTTPRRILEREYAQLAIAFDRGVLRAQLASALPRDALDGWAPRVGLDGRTHHVRAVAPRLVHVMAGNSPLVAAVSITWTALVKGIGLLKMPSNDPFSAVAILQTMASIDPGHPLVRSFAAAYWRGGDTAVDGALLRPQYFDKIVAWGGPGALRHVRQYLGPGLELVAMDPKSSVSLIGAETFASDATLRAVAADAAVDTTFLNQDACASSRFHFVEGDINAVDRYCEVLLDELGIERDFATACGPPPPAALRDEIDVLRDLEPDFRVWGVGSGAGLIVRSDEPLSVHPDGRTVNVIPVASLLDATRYATVATQTVGVFPPSRKPEIRDALAARGVQRVVTLGRAGALELLSGLPHDGMYVLARLARWTVDEA
jgi:Acyl-CoA reductase (LuxC)